MVFPNVLACVRPGRPAPGHPGGRTCWPAPGVHARFQGMLDESSESSTGSANRISRVMCLLSEPPTIDRGEITDKGSINQRAVLTHRASIPSRRCMPTRCHGMLQARALSGPTRPIHFNAYQGTPMTASRKGFFNAFEGRLAARRRAHADGRLLWLAGRDFAHRPGHQGGARRAGARGRPGRAHRLRRSPATWRPATSSSSCCRVTSACTPACPRRCRRIMAQRICGTGFELFRQAGEHDARAAAPMWRCWWAPRA
jgi:hypothetical protein